MIGTSERAAQLAADVAAVAVGQAEVEQHEVGLGLVARVERVGSRRGDQRLEALALRSARANGSAIDASSSTSRMRGLVMSCQGSRRSAPASSGVGRTAIAGNPQQRLCQTFARGWAAHWWTRCILARTPPKEPIVSRITSHVAIATAALVAGGLGATAFSSPDPVRQATTIPGRPLPPQVRTVVVTKTIHRVRHVRVHPHPAPVAAPPPAPVAVAPPTCAGALPGRHQAPRRDPPRSRNAAAQDPHQRARRRRRA